jgi:hypothetical protein
MKKKQIWTFLKIQKCPNRKFIEKVLGNRVFLKLLTETVIISKKFGRKVPY